MKTKGILGMALALALSSAMVVSASAAEGTDGSYGYLAGRQKNSERHAQYEQAAVLSTDADRSAFFAEKGIGGGAHSGMGDMTPTERHAYYAGFDRSGGDDLDTLLAAGIITQEQAEAINAYLAE